MRMSLFSKLEGQIFLICCVCSDKYIRIAPLFVVEYADFLRPLPHLVPQNSGKFWLTYYGPIVSEWNIKVLYGLRGEPSRIPYNEVRQSLPASLTEAAGRGHPVFLFNPIAPQPRRAISSRIRRYGYRTHAGWRAAYSAASPRSADRV